MKKVITTGDLIVNDIIIFFFFFVEKEMACLFKLQFTFLDYVTNVKFNLMI